MCSARASLGCVLVQLIHHTARVLVGLNDDNMIFFHSRICLFGAVMPVDRVKVFQLVPCFPPDAMLVVYRVASASLNDCSVGDKAITSA